VVVYGTGRAIAESRPEAFAEVVSDFLDRQEDFIVGRESLVLSP
jgi:hypothetical protein